MAIQTCQSKIRTHFCCFVVVVGAVSAVAAAIAVVLGATITSINKCYINLAMNLFYFYIENQAEGGGGEKRMSEYI